MRRSIGTAILKSCCRCMQRAASAGHAGPDVGYTAADYLPHSGRQGAGHKRQRMPAHHAPASVPGASQQEGDLEDDDHDSDGAARSGSQGSHGRDQVCTTV